MALADFRINEVVAEAAGSPENRYVELFVAPDTAISCLFPTTRIEVYDSQGQLLGAVAPFATTVCLEGGSFFLFATPSAAAHFAVTRDAKLDVPLPFTGQVCLASSATRYDCARWGPVSPDDAVRYLRNTDDDTSGPALRSDVALARVSDIGVVAQDFILQAPTPREPNSGSMIPTPDAGPALPDAAGIPDARPPDAREFVRRDAPILPRPDGRVSDPAFLEADPGGGAACTCRVGRGGRPPGASGLVLTALFIFVCWRRGA